MSRWAGLFAVGVLGAIVFEAWGLWGVLIAMTTGAVLSAVGAGLMELNKDDE